LKKAQNLIYLPIELINHAVGIRPTVKDRRPVLGLHPTLNSIAFFNGLGTKGVMLAPYFANEMVNLLENESYHLPKEVDLNRFL
jgi:glycine/D-amino acid oxidase-like deaminating enzyme